MLTIIKDHGQNVGSSPTVGQNVGSSPTVGQNVGSSPIVDRVWEEAMYTDRGLRRWMLT